jgi:peptidoglycan/xylan/chitin deacetylase (PgdA/CDA1 family)
MRQTREAEATNEAADMPTPSPRPSPTDTPPDFSGSSTSTTSDGAVPGSELVVNGVEVPILLYHHVREPEGGPAAAGAEYFVSPADFEAHLAYLEENGFTPIDLYALYEHLNESADLPANPVIITFDDGYDDLYENAFPILESYGFTATFFMITDFLEEGREGYMTWEMVEEMAEAGMRFETHSGSHADLRGQTADFLTRQVIDSQEALTRHIGYTPRFIAYPYGQYDQELIQFLEQNDFWGGLTAQSGLEAGLENRFTWPRLYVPGGTTAELFASIISEGRSENNQPVIVEETTISAPVTVTVSISTTQGAITVPARLVYDEELDPVWTVRTSPDVQFDLASEEEVHTGSLALAYTPGEGLASFALQVRPNVAAPYLRDDIVGLAFWLYTGDQPLAPDDLALVVTGSNEFPYWSAVDDSIDQDEYEPTFEDDRFDLNFNQVISPSTWIQIVLFFDDLAYNTGYVYITGVNLVNNVDVTREFVLDELVFILREP